jgi:putative cardiolipin synthase
LAERLVRAADRGVKVRILVDDMNLSGRDDVVASVDAHPNIEIRIFNPFAHRGSPVLDFLTDLDRVNHRMHNKIMVMDNTLAIVGGRKNEWRSIVDSLIWAPGKIVWDDPAAIYDENQMGHIGMAWGKKLETLQHELLIESAYFVVRESGVETIKRLNERGIEVRVLTNSMVSNDALAACAGYSKRRNELVENGVELYELRPDAGAVRKPDQQSMISGKSKAALHTKAMVFDHEAVFIVSYNLDPRAMDINTEAGL